MKLNSKLRLLSICIGLIFFYFGFLKMIPNASPAEALGIDTVSKLCCGVLSESFCIYSLAILEMLIGLCLFTNKFRKLGIWVGTAHLVFTFSPLILFPDLTFQGSLWTPSILGQYIFKNIIIIAALWVIYPDSLQNNQSTNKNSTSTESQGLNLN